MTLRMYCIADWVNYHLYDYTDILTSLRTVQDLTSASGVTRWLDLVFDTLPQLAAPGVVEEDAPLMAWWRQWAAEGGSRHA